MLLAYKALAPTLEPNMKRPKLAGKSNSEVTHPLESKYAYPDPKWKIPEPETLARIAAVMFKDNGKPAESAERAVENAYFLWLAATQLHNLTLRVKRARAKGWSNAESLYDIQSKSARNVLGVAAQKKFVGIPMPDKFPAGFDDFLTLIVKGKTLADSVKLLRDFLRADLKEKMDDPAKSAAMTIGKLKQKDFPTNFQ